MSARRFLLLLLLLLPAFLARATKVYPVTYQSGADVKVFIANYESAADLVVFRASYESQVTLRKRHGVLLPGLGLYQFLTLPIPLPSLPFPPLQASRNDGIWFFTNYQSGADKKVFFCNYQSQADLVIYFTSYQSGAGWKRNAKKYLME